MFDSVLPAESEPNSVVSSRSLWAARCFASICTIALGVGFVAEVAANDIMVALIFFGRWGFAQSCTALSFVPSGEEFTGICAWSGRGNGFHCPAPSCPDVVAIAPPGSLHSSV
jgi:hypothetical protein